MTDREKLIELIGHVQYLGGLELPLADHLLANGVRLETEQATSEENKRWIPVTERLPENDTAVIVATDNGLVFQCLYAYDGWDLWDGYKVNITHWMPLPEPPKEENE